MTGLDLGLGISRSRLFLRYRDQDLSYLVSRPRPRPEPPGLKTKTLATRSQDRDQDLSLQVSSELEFETLGLEITSLVLIPDRHAEVCLVGILRHAFTEYFLALVFIIVRTRSKMHLLGAKNNLLMPVRSNKLLFNYDLLFSYSAIT